MTNTNKITKTMRNNDIIAILRGEPVQHGTTIDEAIKHLMHENELIARKNGKTSDKPTKLEKENAEIKERILAYLSTLDAETSGVTATQIMIDCNVKSSQKVAAVLKPMIGNEVKKEVVKGRSLFSLAF